MTNGAYQGETSQERRDRLNVWRPGIFNVTWTRASGAYGDHGWAHVTRLYESKAEALAAMAAPFNKGVARCSVDEALEQMNTWKRVGSRAQRLKP